MRQRFFATFTIAAVVPFSGHDAPLVQAVSLSNQNQNPMVTAMNGIDDSLPSFAHLDSSEGIEESEQLLVQKNSKTTEPEADAKAKASEPGAEDELTNEMDSDLATFGEIITDVVETKNEEKKVLKKDTKKLEHKVVKAEGEVKRVEGMFSGLGGSSAVLSGLGAAWKVYHSFFSSAAKSSEENYSYHAKLGEQMEKNMNEKKEDGETVDIQQIANASPNASLKTNPDGSPDILALASAAASANTAAETAKATAAAAAPQPMTMTIDINKDIEPSPPVAAQAAAVPAPAAEAAPVAQPAPAAKPEPVASPDSKTKPEAKVEEPKNLSHWDKARNAVKTGGNWFDKAKNHYEEAERVFGGDKYADEKKGLSSIGNKIFDNILAGQTSADSFAQVDESLLYSDIAF